MKYYYVDFENVHDAGLTGIANLSTDCQVTIYWSQKADKLSFNTHMAIMKSNAAIKYVQVQSSQTNAMDKRIIQDVQICLENDQPGCRNSLLHPDFCLKWRHIIHFLQFSECRFLDS